MLTDTPSVPQFSTMPLPPSLKRSQHISLEGFDRNNQDFVFATQYGLENENTERKPKK